MNVFESDSESETSSAPEFTPPESTATTTTRSNNTTAANAAKEPTKPASRKVSWALRHPNTDCPPNGNPELELIWKEDMAVYTAAQAAWAEANPEAAAKKADLKKKRSESEAKKKLAEATAQATAAPAAKKKRESSSSEAAHKRHKHSEPENGDAYNAHQAVISFVAGWVDFGSRWLEEQQQ